LKTRYHGDYHLGRVLLAQNDFVIVDFQAAPGGKHSPLRDAASMLRAIDGAARTALARTTAERAEESAAIEEAVRDWRSEAAGAFLQAYREAATGSGLFGDWNQASGLLDLFTLEMALHDLRRELAEHPELAGVLLRGILARSPIR
jgi:maltose alpha-D-glucosyltransferase/alpha-amylase